MNCRYKYRQRYRDGYKYRQRYRYRYRYRYSCGLGEVGLDDDYTSAVRWQHIKNVEENANNATFANNNKEQC